MARPQSKEEIGGMSARYAYSVWLRHMVNIAESGFRDIPETVAELGPGGTLGLGIAALLTGTKTYHALDAVPYTGESQDLDLVEQIAEILRKREPIAYPGEFPEVKPILNSYDFPSHALQNDRVERYSRQARVEAIQKALQNFGQRIRVESDDGQDVCIKYSAPWTDPDVIEPRSVDLVISQAALEHVSDLQFTYAALERWLKPGGLMSHQIDFRSHNLSDDWNGHWCYSDMRWRMIKGSRNYLLNREPYSSHLKFTETAGCDVVRTITVRGTSGISRNRLAKRFESLTNDDLVTPGALIISKKRF